MDTATWIKLLLAAGAVALVTKAAGGPAKRPSVDGLPVCQNGNGRVREPGDARLPPYCGTEARAC